MSAPFALALLGLDGVGRVTAHRVLERFPTPEALLAAPREQVLLRIKGASRAAATATLLASADALGPALDRARAEVEALAAQGVRVLAPGAPAWPPALDALARPARPLVLYAYGRPEVLARPLVSVLGQPPLPADAFEDAQALARRVWAHGGALAVGARHGLDVALAKLAAGHGGAAVAVVGAGLARLTPSFRPTATALVRAGGLLLSPFPMPHGPFEHDERERALVQAALGRATLALALAPETPESRAAGWVAEARRPLFTLGPVPGEPWAPAARPLGSPPDPAPLLDALVA